MKPTDSEPMEDIENMCVLFLIERKNRDESNMKFRERKENVPQVGGEPTTSARREQCSSNSAQLHQAQRGLHVPTTLNAIFSIRLADVFTVQRS